MKLSEYLDLHNLRPAEFAAQLAISPETVRLWLKGAHRPSNPQYDAISRATGGRVLPNDFLPATDTPSPNAGHSNGDAA